jgi:hypothetical protein
VAHKRIEHEPSASRSAPVVSITTKEVVMNVVIGVDFHNRKLNHAVHMAAVTQIRNPGSEGRIYFERKVAEGTTKKEALRSLKRQISNSVYRQLLFDARYGVREDTQGRLNACVTGSSPCATGSSAKSLPNPEKPYAVVSFHDGSIRRGRRHWK